MAQTRSLPISERILRGLGALLARMVYRVSPHFTERIPEGGFLLLPNHLTWVDAIVLQVACPRPIRFVVDAAIYRKPLLYPVLRLGRNLLLAILGRSRIGAGEPHA